MKKLEVEDVIWKRFWNLTAISYSHMVWSARYFLYRCDCWNEKICNYQNVRTWKTTNCWCMYKLNIEDMIRIKHNKLLIIDYYTKWSDKIYVDCLCDCWNIKKWIYLWKLKKWVKSCWCIRKWKQNRLKHWCTIWWKKIKLYTIWSGIQQRCYDIRSKSYKDYGWIWITCEREKYKYFENDMYESYLEHIEKFWKENTSLDRIDNNWNYCKENCRRATYKEQWNNRKNNISVYDLWERIWLVDFCNKYNINYHKALWLIKKWYTWWMIKDIYNNIYNKKYKSQGNYIFVRGIKLKKEVYYRLLTTNFND